MRVVVRHPARTEADGTEVPESDSAYRQGRVEDFVNTLTGETTPKDEVAAILLEQAKAEFPDCVVDVEFLHDNGDGTSAWKPEPPGQPLPAGEQHEQTLNAEQGQGAAQ